MEEKNLSEYKQQVDKLGQALLDVIASVSLGDFNVNLDIPDDIEVFADLAVGLEFMMKDLDKNQKRSRHELEQKIQERTKELESALQTVQTAQRGQIKEEWEEYSKSDKSAKGLTLENNQEVPTIEEWSPGMLSAVKESSITQETNGQTKQSLAIPIQLQDEVIGVLGFDREYNQPWTEHQITTVEEIVEQVGLALENQRLFDRTEEALSEADTLYQASAELNTAQDYIDILKVVQKYSRFGKSSNGMHICLFDRPWTNKQLPREIQIIAQLPKENSETLSGYQVNESEDFFKDVLSPDEITFIQNPETDPRLDFQMRTVYIEHHQAKSVSFLPMVVGGRWIGFINCLYPQSVEFSEEEFRRTTAITTQASVAIQNLRNIEIAEQRARESQQRSEELALINRVVSSVAATMDLKDSLKLVATELNQAINVDETGIALFNETKETLTLVAFDAKSNNTTSIIGENIPVKGNASIMQVLNTNQPLIIDQSRSSVQASAIHELMEQRQYETMVIIPLISGSEIIGVVTMGTQEKGAGLAVDEMRLAETLILQTSTAIQNARLLEQTQSALTETESLYQANKQLNAVQSHRDVLRVLHQHTILGQNPNYLSIFLFDQPWSIEQQPTSITPIAQWNLTSGHLLDDLPIPFSELKNAKDIMQIDNLTVIEDMENAPKVSGFIRETFLEHQKGTLLLTAPLVSAGRWIGHLIANFPHQLIITDSDSRHLLALAGQAAIAIQNITLLEETSKRANQLETAADIARQSSGTLDTDQLINRAVNLIRDRFGFYHSSIFLKEGAYAVVAASTGEAGRQLVDDKHSLYIEEGSSIIGHVCAVGEPLIVNDVTSGPAHRPHPLLLETRAELGIPLMIGNRVTGALDVQSTRANAFTEDDVAVLRTLADQIAVALDNARSFEVAQQAVVEIREADRLKSEFLANMSHELRTPLNSIIGFSRVILKGIDGPINELQQQDLEAIHHSGQHLLDMINNILDLSKIEAGKMEISIEEIKIGDVIDSVISTARGLVKEKPLKLIDNSSKELPTVLADRTRIRQIMLNLLQNATKFTDEGTITVDTEVLDNLEAKTKFIKISVSDTGIGVALKDQETLFERFSQVDSSLTRKVGGSGLGLSISKHLVEMQGGSIDMISEPGKGSTFWFTLPVSSPAVIEELQIHEEVDTEARIILSIDDDEKVISLYKRYLNPHGYQVMTLTDPLKALEQIKKINPYAITLDIMMPNKDGWHVIQDIKSDPETSSIPIVICSIVEDRDRAYKLGAADYLVKPILEDELVAAIKDLNLSDDRLVHDILIVDDDPDVMQLIEIALRNEPSFRLQYANGGLRGLELMKDRVPDAVILDLMMPDLDGFSVLETMSEDPKLGKIPVIILTAAELTIEERNKIENYKRELLQKETFKGDELITLLENALDNIEEHDNKE